MDKKTILQMGPLLDAIDHPFYIIDIETYEIIIANKSAGDYKNFRTCYQMTHFRNEPCEDGGEHACPLKVVKRTGKPCKTEHIHYNSDGEARIHEVFGYPLKSDKGKIEYMVEYSIDVTNKRKNDKTLFNQSEYLAKVIGFIPDPIIITNEEHRILLLNDSYCEVSGLDKKNTINKTLNEVFGVEKAYEYISKNNKVLSNMNPFTYERSISDSNIKRGFEFIIKKTPFLNAKGEKHLITQYHDVTELKRSQEKISERDEILRLTFDNAADAIVWVDINSKKIINCNKAACNLVERNIDDLIGMEFNYLHPKEEQEKYDHIYEEAFKANVFQIEIEVETSAFEKKLCHLTTSVINYGETTILQGTFRDISKQKQVEQEKDEMKEQLYLSAKMSFLGELSTGIGHEINNPFTVIKGYNKLLLNDIDKNCIDPLKFKKFLMVQDEMIYNISEIIKTLRLYSSSSTENIEKVEVNSIIGRILRLVKNIYMKEDIEINFKTCKEQLYIYAKPGKFQQMMMNLFSNARNSIMACDRDKEGLIEITISNESNDVLISIKDNGVRISEDIKDKIFDSFYTIKGNDQGVGIGLSAVKSFVREIKGSIVLNTNYTRGSEFIIKLPLLK